MSTFLILPLIYIFISFAEAGRILAVFPVPSISHQIVFRPLTQELAKRGHEVTVITPNPAFPKGKTPPNLNEIDVHDISYNIWVETFMKASKGSKDDGLKQIELLLYLFTVVFDAQMKTEDVQKLLKAKNKKYDLLLLEACVPVALGLTHVFEAPVVHVSSFSAPPGNFELMGVSEHPILYPTVLHQRIYNLTMKEKIKEIYAHYEVKKIYEENNKFNQEILEKHFGSDVPSIEELKNKVDLLLVNTNPVLDGSRPVPPNVIYMGGIHQNPEKPLPDDLKKYLDSSKNGVVYVSFGTNVDPTLLPAEKVQTLVRVFSKLPYDVLFKWNNEELPGRTDNIKISKWLPQSDLLRHPKIKLFITQGGLQSTDEAITAGVPLLGIPMLADQWYNVEKYVYHGIGKQLELETLNDDDLLNAVNAIINDESYHRNVIRLRGLMVDQPMKPLERAVWWMEHVLRHGGGKHMRAPTANISWSQYLELELILTILMALLFVATMFVAGLILIYKYLFSGSNDSVKIKQN